MILRKSFYNDGVFDIAHYSAKDGEVFSVNLQGVINNTDINKYLVYATGSIIVRNQADEVVLVRNAGDTTDSSLVEIPEGIYFFEADGLLSEFYSITKVDATAVIRTEHRLLTDGEVNVTEGCLSFLAIGSILDGTGEEVTAPAYLTTTTGDLILATSESLFIELR